MMEKLTQYLMAQIAAIAAVESRGGVRPGYQLALGAARGLAIDKVQAVDLVGLRRSIEGDVSKRSGLGVRRRDGGAKFAVQQAVGRIVRRRGAQQVDQPAPNDGVYPVIATGMANHVPRVKVVFRNEV
ncbi:hypothetical protein G6F31_020290 [Rhizopus arrhizus]|nr:hypothetical protein G6F31_020290 [Rhizopus arrhizus]